MIRAFQISVELITETSLKKNFYMRFKWQTVLLEWDSNLANSCSVIELLSILTQIAIHTR